MVFVEVFNVIASVTAGTICSKHNHVFFHKDLYRRACLHAKDTPNLNRYYDTPKVINFAYNSSCLHGYSLLIAYL